MRLTKTLAGVAAVASAAFALSAANAQASAVTYTLNDLLGSPPILVLDEQTGFITSTMQVTPLTCVDCGTGPVFFDVMPTYDEVTVDTGQPGQKNFFFSTTAFDTVGTQGTTAGGVQNAQLGVTEISSAPEPGTWMLMILGVGMVGGALRYSRGRGWASATA